MESTVQIGERVKIGGTVMIEGKAAARAIVGFTCGSFDLLHAGHMLMLAEAKGWCDHLIVGLQSDPTIDRPGKNKPVMSLEERRVLLEGNVYVDEIVLYDTEADLVNLLCDISPDVRIVGADWKGRPFTGHDLDIEVKFNTRSHSYSSSELRARVYEAERRSRRERQE